MGVERIFPGRGQQWIYPGVAKNIFAARAKMVKFYFIHSKLGKQPFLLKIQ